MPAITPLVSSAARDSLVRLGERIRRQRKQQKVTSVAAAEAAGLSRVTLHRVERGEPGVAMGAWVAVADAVGLAFDLVDTTKSAQALQEIPVRIRIEQYPQLKQLAWPLVAVEELAPAEALALYERNWRHVDLASLSGNERALIRALSMTLGGGRLLV